MDQSQSKRNFDVVLHVGHPKTASTWIQETLFSNPDSGFVFPWDPHECRARATSAFVLTNSYIDDSEAARNYFAEGLKRCEGMAGVPVISDECLCGDPTLRHFYPGRFIADRIHSAFPSAKILIGVREQKSIVISFYREYLAGSGSLRFEEFVGTGNEPLGFTPIMPPDYLEYDRVVGYYQALYGPENVLVLPVELLSRDRVAYVQSVLDFCQCSGRVEPESAPKHVGLSAAALEVRRRLNPIAPSNPLRPPPSTFMQRCTFKIGDVINRIAPENLNNVLETRWQSMVSRRYNGQFRESNRRLAELTKIDFGALGYDV